MKKVLFVAGGVGTAPVYPQVKWFYDNNRRKAVAESYIFHGPKYYGISSNEVFLSAIPLDRRINLKKVRRSR